MEDTLRFLLGSPEERAWMLRGRCAGVNPAVFFPDEEQQNWAVRVAEAKAICEPCVVKSTCLEWALSRHENKGVWGGASERERVRIRRRRAKQERKRRKAEEL